MERVTLVLGSIVFRKVDEAFPLILSVTSGEAQPTPVLGRSLWLEDAPRREAQRPEEAQCFQI